MEKISFSWTTGSCRFRITKWANLLDQLTARNLCSKHLKNSCLQTQTTGRLRFGKSQRYFGRIWRPCENTWTPQEKKQYSRMSSCLAAAATPDPAAGSVHRQHGTVAFLQIPSVTPRLKHWSSWAPTWTTLSITSANWRGNWLLWMTKSTIRADNSESSWKQTKAPSWLPSQEQSRPRCLARSVIY